jgi:Fur family ferric uptake transcriptional regulator
MIERVMQPWGRGYRFLGGGPRREGDSRVCRCGVKRPFICRRPLYLTFVNRSRTIGIDNHYQYGRSMAKGISAGPHWWRGTFKGGGHRLTAPRQAILGVLSKTSEHLSAEEIYMAVHKTYPAIGLTTIYRTLDLLVAMGVIVKFDFGDKRARYELAEGLQGKRHHHHLLCTQCGKIIEYTDFMEEEKELLGRTEKGLSKKFNFKITNHIIQFYGLCDKCQKK